MDTKTIKIKFTEPKNRTTLNYTYWLGLSSSEAKQAQERQGDEQTSHLYRPNEFSNATESHAHTHTTKTQQNKPCV
jgi:hypothetical protein